MSRARELGFDIKTFFNAKPAFLAGVLDAMNVPGFFDNAYENQRTVGSYPDIPWGTVAKLFLINVCDDHHPLYRMKEYFLDKDLPMLAGSSVSLEQLGDDRFGDFLDHMFSWNPRALFSNIATNAFFKYGLSIRSLNYDTTSKVMWGEYEDADGPVGVISITLGHSKNKRGDKNQLKVGLGTADGAIIDAKVLSGNVDDKTYNNVTIDDVGTILDKHHVDRDTFYYIADAAFFTEENIKKAHGHGIHFITRAPETVTVTKDLLDKAWDSPADFRTVEFTNAQNKTVEYHVQEFAGEYRGYQGQFAVCHSPTLEAGKRKTVTKHIDKEKKELDKMAKGYAERKFVCEPDAQKEIEALYGKALAKTKYHTINLTVVEEEKKRRGRPPKDLSKAQKEYVYRLSWDIQADHARIDLAIKRKGTFVLTSNDLRLSAEQMLGEYKTQTSVEKKFQQLKSPHFVNSLYLNKPERIEALVYLILIAMMVLSVAERVVRREMESEGETVIGPGGIKMKRPSLRAIVGIFHYAPVNRENFKGQVTRELVEPLNPSQEKVLRYLGVPPTAFTDGPRRWD